MPPPTTTTSALVEPPNAGSGGSLRSNQKTASRNSGSSLARPDGAHEVRLPDRSAQEHRRLRAQEGRGLALEYPEVRIRRLLADERGDDARDAADVDLQYVVGDLLGRAGDRNSLFSSDAHHYLHQ